MDAKDVVALPWCTQASWCSHLTVWSPKDVQLLELGVRAESSISTPPSQLRHQNRGENYRIDLVMGGAECFTSPSAQGNPQAEVGPYNSGWRGSK